MTVPDALGRVLAAAVTAGRTLPPADCSAMDGYALRAADLAGATRAAPALDKATQQQLGRGQRMQEILKQPQYQPMSLSDQVIVLFAGTNGYADQVALPNMAQWQTDLLRFMETSYPEVGRDIVEKKMISDSNRQNMIKALDAFSQSWQAA